MPHDILSITIAFLGGVIPAIVWTIFWNEEDRKNPEPKSMIVLAFIGGIVAVFLSLLFEKIVFDIDPHVIFSGSFFQPFLNWLVGAAAAKHMALDRFALVVVFAPVIEELLKFILAYVLVLRTQDDDEPIDPVIYMITCALGFAAIENMLFLIDPVTRSNIGLSILTGNMRFIGAMLLHTVSSAIIGIIIGLNFFDRKLEEWVWTVVGIGLAILVHAVFNYFMIATGQSYLAVLEVIWVIVIIILYVIERVKRIHLERIN